MREVAIVPTGTANVASVAAAFERVGATVRACEDARALAEAPTVVLPGVGSYAAAAARIDSLGLRSVLRERIDAGRPTLAICLGMQLFATSSEESPGVPGLGVVDAAIERLPRTVQVPQLGWNRITPLAVADEGLLRPGYAYFANSYRLANMPQGWAGALTNHGGRFVSALERGAVLACQFHPEVSGRFGQDLLRRWLERSELEASC